MPDSMRKYLRPCLQQNPPSPLRPPGRLPWRICCGKTQNPNLSSRLGSCQPDRCAKSVAVVTARSRHATATGKRTAAASISILSRTENHVPTGERKCVVLGKRVSVREEYGGRRNAKKNNEN